MDKVHSSKKSVWTQVARRWQLYAFLLVPVIYILIFAYYPMLGVQIAFKNFMPRQGIWGSKWVGFQHFRKFFESYYFSRTVSNTIRLSLYFLAVNFPLSIIFSLMLNIIVNPKLKKTIQTIVYIPHFISTVVLVGMLMQIMNPVAGLYGNLYRLLIADTYPTDILSKAFPFVHFYVWSGIWQNLGWNTIIYMTALTGIDPGLHEAAQIDGASRFKQMIHIDLPSLLPTASILLILNAGSIMNIGFEKVYLMQNNINVVYSEVISTYVYKVGLTSATNQYSYAAAIGLFNNVINGALLLIVNAISNKLSDGANGLF